MEKRNWTEYDSGKLKGLQSLPLQNEGIAKSILILLHGIGSNETALLNEGEEVAPTSKIISIRSPITLGRIAFAWFQVDVSETSRKHNEQEARDGLKLLTTEINKIAADERVPLDQVFVFGFSQGAIMVLGLYLQSELTLGGYLASSGRTLPEFETFAKAKGRIPSDRAIYLTHGIEDHVLSIDYARKTRDLIAELDGELTYREFSGDHDVPLDAIPEMQKWIALRLKSPLP